MKKIIDRYILKEIAFPFFMILFILTFVLLMGKILQLMDLMVNKGIRVTDIALLIIYLMPSFLLFTIPISLFVAIMMGLGRLSGDNELLVMKAAGMSLYRLARPVFVAVGACFLLTALTSYYLAPHGNFAVKSLLFDLARQKAGAGIKEKVFNDEFSGILLYADKVPVNGEFMSGVLISDTRNTTEQRTIIADRAYLIADPKAMTVTLRLENGASHSVDRSLNNYRRMDFGRYDLKLDLGGAMSGDVRKTKASTEMTVGEMVKQMQDRKLKDADLRELAIEINKKFSIPVSTLVFGILGIPLGIRKHRTAKYWGFTIGLAVVIVYYLLRLGGEALAETGRLTPFLGAWLPNFALGVAGIWLFLRAAAEKPLLFRLPRKLVKS
ncbi:MAG TPA: LPS export ABC transporter permease LptF [Syntrophales bacterium]|jgi:lipopolysaccharide export system permease protein|nr:LPS export ABC transporter permease LptF [Syntrophales bacterium]HOU78063.1 LPS export ABC transporter permease LptF [Syntrophales bacterium]HPC32560.1 LPS export ABC transporter permease LptF [Syntrophales bacterium]HQG34069.1 LPS export ABC transporter permease LptF [Syntrophales bacterium]HQI35847.1 LPS export ABC transporter permease LptF [Syntrophales bacterium]